MFVIVAFLYAFNWAAAGFWTSLAIGIPILLFTVVWPLYGIIKRAWKSRTMYVVDFPEERFPALEVRQPTSKRISVGERRVAMRIKVAVMIDVQRFNTRFVQTEEGENVPGETIQIIQASPSEGGGSTHFGVHEFAQIRDEAGGMTLTFDPPYRLGEGEYLWLYLRVGASKPWKGYLSVRGYDHKGNRHYCRQPFEVIVPASQSDTGSNEH